MVLWGIVISGKYVYTAAIKEIIVSWREDREQREIDKFLKVEKKVLHSFAERWKR